MAQEERYRGEMNGQRVSFKRDFRGHYLTDAECKLLCAGRELEVRNLVSKTSGKSYGVSARLVEKHGFDEEKQRDFTYYVVDATGFLKRGIPDEWKGHVFTDDEKIMLEDGRFVQVSDLISNKTGKPFSARVRYDETEDRLILSFDR